MRLRNCIWQNCDKNMGWDSRSCVAPAVAACHSIAEPELLGKGNAVASGCNRAQFRIDNHVARDQRVDHFIVAEVVRHNLQRLAHPGTAKQIEKHGIGELGVLANCAAEEHGGWCLRDLALQVVEHTVAGNSRVFVGPELQPRMQITPRVGAAAGAT